MEDEDAELEEGEAKEALDPDKDFSYLDSRLERLLGDCQKEFQGGNLSTEKLGSKYGGYGTFLPTQARVPSVLADPHPAPPNAAAAAEVGRSVAEGVAATAEPVKRSTGTTVQQASAKENGVVNAVAPNKVKLKIKLGKQQQQQQAAPATAAPAVMDTEEAKRKALYNGLGLDDLSDDDQSLDDDDDDDDDDDEDNYSRSNVESPEPSPERMIEMMTVHCPEGGLLSPLSDSILEFLDVNTKEYTKPGPFSTATSNAHPVPPPPSSKVDLNSPRAPAAGLDFARKGSKGLDLDKPPLDIRKGADFFADSNGGRKSRRDSDADKTIAKERPSKPGRNDAVRGEPQEFLDEKGMEVFSKEGFDIVRDPSKSSRKPHDSNKPLSVNGQKEKDVTDAKGHGKSQVSRVRDSKEFSRSRPPGNKVPTSKDNEVVRTTDSEKEIASDVRKQGKEDNRIPALIRSKENPPKEGFRENHRKDAVGEVKSKEPSTRDVSKPGSNPSGAKKSSGVAGRKSAPLDHKSSKIAPDRKSSMKELEKERLSLPIPLASKDEEKAPAVVEPASASFVVPQLVLENWVACDKCEKWRLLMPNMAPISPSKKWRCKMMDWLPGMNNCKFSEEETTAAVYKLLGLQNPAALPAAALPAAAAVTAAAAAPVTVPAPIPVSEPLLDKWADEVNTKKIFLPKKGVARKTNGSGAKVSAGGKGADGAVKSKNVNDMGLENPGDGTAVGDKQKPKAREKVKRSRASEGDDTRVKKKTLQEQERTREASPWGKEAMDLELIQGEKERGGLAPPGEPQSGGQWKRKKTVDDLDETPNLKKNKGGRARLQFDDPQAPHEEDYAQTDKRANVQKSKRETSMLKPKDVSHSGLQDKETQDINAVLKDLRDYEGAPEKRREDSKDQGRRSKASEKPWRSKGDASDSEQRTWKKRRDDASHDRPNQGREEAYRSTSSKVSLSSSGSSGLGLKGVGSPLESTVSSSPVRAANGNNNSREFFSARVGAGHAVAITDIAMQSSSPATKHVRAASRGSSLDEGEYRHPGATHNTTRFAKQDSSGEARDNGWYDEEDRGVDRGQNHNHHHHPERHPHSSGDVDEVDGQQVRRKGHRERDSDSRRLDIRDNDHGDHHAKDRNTNARDDRGRPGLDKPGERPLEDSKPDGVKYAHKRDDASAQAHGARVAPPAKDNNRESDRLVQNVRKDGVGPSDFSKRPGASSNTRSGGDRGEALKRDDLDGVVKSSVGEAATSSPVKKDKEQHAQVMQIANNYLKDAKDLKHSADRLKRADETEGADLYLQSALKFLQAAALMESVQAESRSMDLYKDTAALCEFCAMQYKRRGDLRATALAYTCAAVARTRLMMSKRLSFASDCKEFQNAAQLPSGPHMPSNGESPSSSSASDVDNLNKHHGLVPGNKTSLGKAAIVSPQVPSGASGTSLNIPARMRPIASRFLRDANDMTALLDSWKTAADATAKAEASKVTEGMTNVKQVGVLGGLGDIDGVVRLVRVALDAIGH